MTTEAIADILKANLLDLEMVRLERRKIIPICQECGWTDEILDTAMDECRQLAKQCDGLKIALPHNTKSYDLQFQDAIRKVADGIQQKLELDE